MIQGWRRFGETTGVQEGDTVTIEMVEDTVMQLTIERTGSGNANASGANNVSAKKRPRQPSAAPAAMGGLGGHGLAGGAPPQFGDRQLLAAAQLQQQHQLAQHEQEAEAVSRELLQAQGLLPSTMQQQQAAAPVAGLPQQHAAQQPPGQQGHPHGLAALLTGGGQQQQQQTAGGGNPGRPGSQPATVTPRSLTQSLANGLVGPLVQLAAGGNFNEAQLADLTDMISRLEKRQRLAGDGVAAADGGAAAAAAAGGAAGAPGQAGAIRLLSDAADVEGLVQENMGLREELRMLQAKVRLGRLCSLLAGCRQGRTCWGDSPCSMHALYLTWPAPHPHSPSPPVPPQIATLETGVLNIKSVLTRNTDPGLIAMTGVINLLVRRPACLLWAVIQPAGCMPGSPDCASGLLLRHGRVAHLLHLPDCQPASHALISAPSLPFPLQNQMESPDFLPELGTIGRMTLTGLCSEVRRGRIVHGLIGGKHTRRAARPTWLQRVWHPWQRARQPAVSHRPHTSPLLPLPQVRRHLNGVLRMVWILRSLPDDVQQHNMGSAPGGNSAE